MESFVHHISSFIHQRLTLLLRDRFSRGPVLVLSGTGKLRSFGREDSIVGVKYRQDKFLAQEHIHLRDSAQSSVKMPRGSFFCVAIDVNNRSDVVSNARESLGQHASETNLGSTRHRLSSESTPQLGISR